MAILRKIDRLRVCRGAGQREDCFEEHDDPKIGGRATLCRRKKEVISLGRSRNRASLHPKNTILRRIGGQYPSLRVSSGEGNQPCQKKYKCLENQMGNVG